MNLGTVLPTKASLAASDRYAEQLAMQQASTGRIKLAHCDRRMVGGEVRYYESPKRYAIINRSLRVVWFEVGPNGDYAV